MLKEVIKATVISVLCLCVIYGIMACAFKDNFTPVENQPTKDEPSDEPSDEPEDKPSYTPPEKDQPSTPEEPSTPSDPKEPADEPVDIPTSPAAPALQSEDGEEEEIIFPDSEGYDFAVNIEQFNLSIRQLVDSCELLHGPHTLLVKGLSVPLVLTVRDGHRVIGISAYGMEIKLDKSVSLNIHKHDNAKNIYEADGIIVVKNVLVYPGGYTKIENESELGYMSAFSTRNLDGVTCYFYEENGKLVYSRYVNRIYYDYIFDSDEVYIEKGIISHEDGKLIFEEPTEIKTAAQVKDIEALYIRTRKTEDTTVQQWYTDRRAEYEKSLKQEKSVTVDIDEAVELINSDKKLELVASYIGGFYNRLLFYEINQPDRNFEVYLVSSYREELMIEGKKTLTIPGQYAYDTVTYVGISGGGGSGETGIILALKDGDNEYYLDFYLEVSDKDVCRVLNVSVMSDRQFAERVLGW